MNDTIAAISTAHGAGAIGIIRISGPNVLSITSQLLHQHNIPITKNFLLENKRKALYCDLIWNQRKLDQIVFLFYKGPNSFTGEDLAELYLHGNPILLEEVLHIIWELGARPALQGEFTKRSFLNGKLDLTEAEAIGQLISSRSRFELELAQKNVFGEISKISSRIRSDLISLKAECEAEIDFSTEDLTFESQEERKKRMLSIVELCQSLVSKSDQAHRIADQAKVVLYGEPNTGKSSLLNQILGRERAIISDIPGTTRDYISEELHLEGIPIRLVDTAGVRDTEDSVEKLGIEKSEKEFETANVKLLLVDTSQEKDWPSFWKGIESKAKDGLIIANKIDIAHPSWTEQKENLKARGWNYLEISCKSGQGLEALLKTISSRLKGLDSAADYVLLEDRQKYHMTRISTCLQNALNLMEGSAPAEVYIKEIDYALEEVGQVMGRVSTEEILGRIFSKFCVGK